MASFRKRGSLWYFRHKNEAGKLVEVRGCPDRRRTEAMARDAESRVAALRSGLLDPMQENLREHASRPIKDHLDAWERYLAAKGGSKKHPGISRRRAEKVLELAKVRNCQDMGLARVGEAIGQLRARFAGETVNHHIRAVKGFARWLWKDGRIQEHALAHLATTTNHGDRRRVRRALTAEEAARLVQATTGAPLAFSMTGINRAIAYAIALGTGFRAEEIRRLERDDFRLDTHPPTITCRAAYTKNGIEAVQPIPDHLATRLRAWTQTQPTGTPLLRLPNTTAEMIRRDLTRAGIPYQTPDGVADFHSHRVTYISTLVQAGTSVKVAQTLARHSTPSLTIGVYARIAPHDVVGAVQALPDPSATTTPSEPAILARTGTDETPLSDPYISDRFAQHLPNTLRARGLSVSHHVVMDEATSCPEERTRGRSQPVVGQEVEPSSPHESHGDFSTGGGSRTHTRVTPKRILSPVRHSRNPFSEGGLRQDDCPVAQHLPNPRVNAPDLPPDLPDDLAEVINAWGSLPEPLRGGILAMVRAARTTRS